MTPRPDDRTIMDSPRLRTRPSWAVAAVCALLCLLVAGGIGFVLGARSRPAALPPIRNTSLDGRFSMSYDGFMFDAKYSGGIAGQVSNLTNTSQPQVLLDFDLYDERGAYLRSVTSRPVRLEPGGASWFFADVPTPYPAHYRLRDIRTP